jgi:FkbM family methyltransferase
LVVGLVVLSLVSIWAAVQQVVNPNLEKVETLEANMNELVEMSKSTAQAGFQAPEMQQTPIPSTTLATETPMSSVLTTRVSLKVGTYAPTRQAKKCLDLLLNISHWENAGAMIIGANVGSVGNDDSWKALMESQGLRHWSKIFIEPMPLLFGTLEKNIAKSSNSELAFAVNRAVVDEDFEADSIKIFCLNGKKLAEQKLESPWWLPQTCSTIRERLFASYDLGKLGTREQLEFALEEFDVKAQTVDAIFRENAMFAGDKIEYVQIDTEGYDAFIVKSLTIRPKILTYENVVISKEANEELVEVLESRGYKLACQGHQSLFWTREDE